MSFIVADLTLIKKERIRLSNYMASWIRNQLVLIKFYLISEEKTKKRSDEKIMFAWSPFFLSISSLRRCDKRATQEEETRKTAYVLKTKRAYSLFLRICWWVILSVRLNKKRILATLFLVFRIKKHEKSIFVFVQARCEVNKKNARVLK